jgi:hypothetical protein
MDVGLGNAKNKRVKRMVFIAKGKEGIVIRKGT